MWVSFIVPFFWTVAVVACAITGYYAVAIILITLIVWPLWQIAVNENT